MCVLVHYFFFKSHSILSCVSLAYTHQHIHTFSGEHYKCANCEGADVRFAHTNVPSRHALVAPRENQYFRLPTTNQREFYKNGVR